MRIHVIQHVPFETPAAIANWCDLRGHTLQNTAIYQNEILPNLNSYEMLVLLGGPMNVNQTALYPWLHKEIKIIQQAILAEKKVFGICLGAQLIAAALDARIEKGPCKEIGWFPVTLVPNEGQIGLFDQLANPFYAFHWHGDTFQIPNGAFRIAESTACSNQAFQYKKHVLGIQFHLETNEQSLENLIEHCADELGDGPWIQDAATMQNQTFRIPELHQSLFSILDLFTRVDTESAIPQ